MFHWLLFDTNMADIFYHGAPRGGNATSRPLSPPEPGSVMTVSKTKSFAKDIRVANSWQILSGNPAQILAAGEIKSIPAILLKFMTAFDLRTTTFCA